MQSNIPTYTSVYQQMNIQSNPLNGLAPPISFDGCAPKSFAEDQPWDQRMKTGTGEAAENQPNCAWNHYNTVRFERKNAQQTYLDHNQGVIPELVDPTELILH